MLLAMALLVVNDTAIVAIHPCVAPTVLHLLSYSIKKQLADLNMISNLMDDW
jgi:hypothetical protein